MAVLQQFKAKCEKCKKEYKTFGSFDDLAIVEKRIVYSFCEKCSKELKKILDEWLSEPADNDEFSFKEKLEKMEISSRRDIQVICLYWKFKKIDIENKEQYNSLFSRELRPAKRLVGFSDEQILEIMEYLQNENTFKWSLESVLKYIGENLKQIKPIVK